MRSKRTLKILKSRKLKFIAQYHRPDKCNRPTVRDPDLTYPKVSFTWIKISWLTINPPPPKKKGTSPPKNDYCFFFFFFGGGGKPGIFKMEYIYFKENGWNWIHSAPTNNIFSYQHVLKSADKRLLYVEFVCSYES